MDRLGFGDPLYRTWARHELTAEEWESRVNFLREKLRHVETGHGIDRHMAPIKPHLAKSWDEYDDSCELISLEKNRPLPEGDFKSYRFIAIIDAVRWSRSIIQDEGWGSVYCIAFYSSKHKDWRIINKARRNKLLNRNNRELSRQSVRKFMDDNFRAPFLTQVTARYKFRLVYWLIKSEEVAHRGDKVWYASEIIEAFRNFMDCRKKQPDYAHTYMFKLGELWGEVKIRLEIENDAIIRQKSLPRFRDLGAAALAEINKRRSLEAEQWKQEAKKIASASSRSGGALEKHVQTELIRRGFPSRSWRSIRRALSKTD